MKYRDRNPLYTLTISIFFFQNDFTVFYKQAERQTFSLAIVNCCIQVQLSDSGEVKNFRMLFGGISGKVVAAEKQLSKYFGRLVNGLKQKDMQLLEKDETCAFCIFFYIS